MGNTNQEVPKPPDNRQEVPKPPNDDNVSFMYGMSAFLEHITAQQNQLTKDTRKPVPKPRQLEGSHPTVTGVKAFLKEIEDRHGGHPGSARTAKMVNTMRRDPTLPVTYSFPCYARQ